MPDYTPAYKTCIHCKTLLPLVEYHRNAQNPDGYANICRKCRSGLYGFRYIPVPPPGYRYCSKCGQLKAETKENYCRDKSGKGGLSAQCNSCRNEYRSRYREAHREKLSQDSLTYYHTHKVVHKNIYKVDSNLSPIYPYQRRRKRERDLPNTFTGEDWQRALDYFGGCCAVCGRPPGLWHTIVQDHWIPIASRDCPGTIPANIIPLCHGKGGCNNSKRAEDAVTWLRKRYSTRRVQKILDRITSYFDSLAAKVGFPSEPLE